MKFPDSFPDKELLKAINKEISRNPGSVQSIIRRKFLVEFQEYVRPFLFIKGGTFDIPSNPIWQDVLRDSREVLEKIIPSIGSIEVKKQNSRRAAGTGWLIAQGIIVTCDHVIEEFSQKEEGVFIDSDGERTELAVDFIKEQNRPDKNIFRIVQILKRYPDPDIAFLQVEPVDSATVPVPIGLLDSPAADMDVAVIGFPGEDDDTPQLSAKMLDDFYNVKRLQPGKVISPVEGDTLFHDCSTLADSSGSPLIESSTGKAVGLHFGNRGTKNLATPAKIIREKMKDAKII